MMSALARLRRRMPGATRAEALALVREAAAEYLAAPLRRADAFSQPVAVADYCRARWTSEPVEVLAALFLDSKHRLITAEELHRGTVDACPCIPRELVRRALAVNAAAVILTHNHPSGHPEPSAPDITATQRCKAACDACGVHFLDHVVTGREGYVSLRERRDF